MHAEERTGYGLRNEQLVHVSEVDRGMRCECVCVVCRSPLIAKKGSVNRHHFAHAHTVDCVGAAETALHLLSKELFASLKSFAVPQYEFSIKRETAFGRPTRHEKVVAKGEIVNVTSAQVENGERGFVLDIMIQSGDRLLVVEIAVTHRVGRDKLRRIRDRDVAAIEIQFDPSDALLDRDALREKLQNDLNSKVWLFHPRQREVEREFFKQYRLARAKERAAKRPSLIHQIQRHPPSSHARYVRNFDNRSLMECDRQIRLFMEEHGRGPTTKECLTLWPQFWAP